MSVAWTHSDELDTIAQDKRVATLARMYVKSKDSASASSFHCFFLAVFSSTGKTIYLVIFWKNMSTPSHPPVFARVVNLLQGGVPEREDAPFGKLERAA